MRPLKTWNPAIKFVPVISALVQCLLNHLMDALAPRSAATRATAVDLSIVRRMPLSG